MLNREEIFKLVRNSLKQYDRGIIDRLECINKSISDCLVADPPVNYNDQVDKITAYEVIVKSLVDHVEQMEIARDVNDPRYTQEEMDWLAGG